jgi:hypothetical protein
MALTKGIGFLNVQAFVCERHGVGAWAEVLERFPEAEQRTLEAIVSPGWYDLGLYARLIRAAEDLLGKGDPRYLYTLGRFEAERDLGTITRWLLRLFRPSVAIEQMGKYWDRFHDSGRWTLLQRDDRVVAAKLEGWGVIDAALCRELTGYLGRTLELLGGKDVSIDHTRCRARSDAACEFRARWKLRRDVPADPMDENEPLSATGARAAIPPPRPAGSSSTPPPSRTGYSTHPPPRGVGSPSTLPPRIPTNPPPRIPTSPPPPRVAGISSTPPPPRATPVSTRPPRTPSPSGPPSSVPPPPSSHAPGSSRARPEPLSEPGGDTRRNRGS